MGAAWAAVVFLIAGVAVVAGIVLLATGRLRDELPDSPPAEAIQGLPAVAVGELSPPALDDVRIDQAWRGYRMDEVDALIDRLGAEIAIRDAEIARLGGAESPESAESTETTATADPTESTESDDA